MIKNYYEEIILTVELFFLKKTLRNKLKYLVELKDFNIHLILKENNFDGELLIWNQLEDAISCVQSDDTWEKRFSVDEIYSSEKIDQRNIK